MTSSDRKIKTTRPLTIRLPQPLYEELKRGAEQNGWTMNDEINYLLRLSGFQQKIDSIAADVAAIKRISKLREEEE